MSHRVWKTLLSQADIESRFVAERKHDDDLWKQDAYRQRFESGEFDGGFRSAFGGTGPLFLMGWVGHRHVNSFPNDPVSRY